MLAYFLSHAHWLAILVAAVLYFLLGSLWFSVLFGKLWASEVAKHGVVIKDAEKKQIGSKMVQTFLFNFAAALSIAYIVFASGCYNWLAGLKMGLLCGGGIASMAIWIASVWESRPFTLVAIDAGYALTGMAICGTLIAAWH